MNIRELADQAGLDWHKGWNLDDNEPNRFSVFALLVAAAEREECAKLFELTHKDSTVPPVHFSLSDTAKIIRARGKA